MLQRLTPVDVVTASARSGWAPGIDLRLVVDRPRGLFLMGDGFGPTYGGHHFPLALDPAVDAVCGALQGASSPDVREAIEAGNQVACGYMAKYGSLPTQVSAGLAAADVEALMHARARAAPSRLFHCALGITLVLVAGGTLHVAQVGMSRAYLSRGGTLRVLLRDHSLPSQVAARHGTESPEYRSAFEFHRTVVLRMLGVSPAVQFDHTVEPLQASDVVLLCSSGVWSSSRGEEIVRQIAGAPADELDGLARAAMNQSGIDAALIRFRVDAEPPGDV